MEEPKVEEEKENVIDKSGKASIIQKIRHILSVVTIEPVVFLHYLSFAITLFSQNQMIVYKTCRGLISKHICSVIKVQSIEDKYNLTAEYCSNIEDHTDDGIYSEIENEVSSQLTPHMGFKQSLTGCQFQQCKIPDRKLCPCSHCILHWKLE